MKESSWNDCTEENSAIKISPDKARAKSLIETADERIKVIPRVNEKNCNFAFEDYYTSIMELLQALVIYKRIQSNQPYLPGLLHQRCY